MNIHGRAALFVFFLAATAVAATTPQTVATQLHSSALQLNRGVHVAKVTLRVGAATIELIDGTVIPRVPEESRDGIVSPPRLKQSGQQTAELQRAIDGARALGVDLTAME